MSTLMELTKARSERGSYIISSNTKLALQTAPMNTQYLGALRHITVTFGEDSLHILRFYFRERRHLYGSLGRNSVRGKRGDEMLR